MSVNREKALWFIVRVKVPRSYELHILVLQHRLRRVPIASSVLTACIELNVRRWICSFDLPVQFDVRDETVKNVVACAFEDVSEQCRI